MRPITTALTAAALALSLPAGAQDFDATTPMATVNDHVITLGHMIALYENLPEQYSQLGAEVLFPGILDQLIDQALIADVVSADPANDPLRARLSLENQRWSILSNLKIEELTAQGVSEEALQAAFDEKYGDVAPTPEFNASHILVETEEAASDLIEQLTGGADFASLAKVHSTGPSGPRGGELGWFAPGAMVPAFDTAVQGMEVGAVAGPVETQFGWHVIKLNDTRQVPSVDSAREELTDIVLRDRIEGDLEAMRAAASVTRHSPEVPLDAILDSTLLEPQ